MPKLYNQEGQPLDEDQLEFGDIVYDDTGAGLRVRRGRGRGRGEDEDEDEPVPELAGVGKSAFFEKSAPQAGSFSAVGDGGALQGVQRLGPGRGHRQGARSGRGAGDGSAARSTKIAKSERDLRLTREYISKAAEYNLPIAPDELGPVLYRMAETMSYDDCAVIAKCLETAGEIIFEETGYTGGGDNTDVYSQVEAHAYDTFGKSEDFNAVSAINTVFDQNPDAYDEYLRSQQAR